jgi:hypothetical protein
MEKPENGFYPYIADEKSPSTLFKVSMRNYILDKISNHVWNEQ